MNHLRKWRWISSSRSAQTFHATTAPVNLFWRELGRSGTEVCASQSVRAAHKLRLQIFIPAKTSPWSSRSKWLSVFCDVIKRVGVMRCSRGNAIIRSASTCAAALRLASLAYKAQNFLMVLPQRSAVAYRNKRDVQLLAVLVQKPLAVLGDTYY